MASVTFKRGTRAEIEATAKQDGQILMETDQNKKNKMYIDLPDGSRVLIGNSGEAIDTSYDNTTSGLDATNVQSAIDTLNSNLTYYDVLYQSETTISSGTNIPLSKSAYDYKKLLIVIKLSGLENRSFEIIPGVDKNSFTEVVNVNNQWYLNTVEAQINNDGNTLKINAVYAMNWSNPTLVVIYGQKYL